MKNGNKAVKDEKSSLGRKAYESELRDLQVELARLQAWVKKEASA